MSNATIKNNTIEFLTNKIVKYYIEKHNGENSKMLEKLDNFSIKEKCEIHMFLKNIDFDFDKSFDMQNKKFCLCKDWYTVNFDFSDKVSSKTIRSLIKSYNITIKTHEEIMKEIEAYIQENFKA